MKLEVMPRGAKISSATKVSMGRPSTRRTISPSTNQAESAW